MAGSCVGNQTRPGSGLDLRALGPGLGLVWFGLDTHAGAWRLRDPQAIRGSLEDKFQDLYLFQANGSQSSSSLNGASALQNVNVKVEEGAGSSSSEAPGFSLANVKTEPSDMVKTEPPEPASTSEKKPPEPMPETSKAPAVKKVFTVEELSDALLPVWEKLEATDDAIPFRIPVDPKLLGIPVSTVDFCA